MVSVTAQLLLLLVTTRFNADPWGHAWSQRQHRVDGTRQPSATTSIDRDWAVGGCASLTALAIEKMHPQVGLWYFWNPEPEMLGTHFDSLGLFLDSNI